MPEISFPVEVVEGVPVVTAPEEIDIANAAGLRAALLEAAVTAGPGAPWSWSTCPGPGSAIRPG